MCRFVRKKRGVTVYMTLTSDVKLPSGGCVQHFNLQNEYMCIFKHELWAVSISSQQFNTKLDYILHYNELLTFLT